MASAHIIPALIHHKGASGYRFGMLLHFRSHLTILDVILKFAFYIRYHGNGKGGQRKFDFLALAVLTDNVAPLPVFFIVKTRNRLIKGINQICG